MIRSSDGFTPLAFANALRIGSSSFVWVQREKVRCVIPLDATSDVTL
jgi:hypothetical protein